MTHLSLLFKAVIKIYKCRGFYIIRKNIQALSISTISFWWVEKTYPCFYSSMFLKKICVLKIVGKFLVENLKRLLETFVERHRGIEREKHGELSFMGFSFQVALIAVRQAKDGTWEPRLCLVSQARTQLLELVPALSKSALAGMCNWVWGQSLKSSNLLWDVSVLTNIFTVGQTPALFELFIFKQAL